jgi:hypothetical protein
MNLLERKAEKHKIDKWRCYGKLTNKLSASDASVLATGTSSEQVDFMCNTGLNTRVMGSKKWVFKCEFNMVFFKVVLSSAKNTDLISICVNRLPYTNWRFYASLQ